MSTTAGQRCDICLETIQSDSLKQVFKCQNHEYCVGCLEQMFEFRIKEGSFEELKCPHEGCQMEVKSETMIKELVAGKTWDRFIEISFQKFLGTLPGLLYCPKCDAPVLADERGYDYAHCSGCDYCFCVKCKNPWHNGKCQVTKVEEMTGQMARAAPLTDDDKILLATTTKRCPGCLVEIEKNGGCDHMICKKCSLHFSWSLAPNSEHLNSRIRRLLGKRAKEARKREQLLRTPFVPPANSKRCPNCRAFQTKSTNLNQVNCTNCRAKFCFECLQVIRDYHHYGVGSKCRQHSQILY